MGEEAPSMFLFGEELLCSLITAVSDSSEDGNSLLLQGLTTSSAKML